MNLLGFDVGDTVKLYCVKTNGVFVVTTLVSDYASISAQGSWFVFEGTIGALDATRVPGPPRRPG